LTITKDLFDALLEWLDPDREKASERYKAIHAGLVRMFVSKGVSDAGHAADETMDRVMKRLPEIRASYVGDPAKYFHGVARNLILEDRRRKEVPTDCIPDLLTKEPEKSEMSECLAKCLKLLPTDKQEFILDYHLYQGRAKVEHHREMAGEFSISEGALRTRAHHLRVILEKCVDECISRHGKTKVAPDAIISSGGERGSDQHQ
jgi:DNA-directed RNA polymerase specialized sigma24 family protein